MDPLKKHCLGILEELNMVKGSSPTLNSDMDQDIDKFGLHERYITSKQTCWLVRQSV